MPVHASHRLQLQLCLCLCRLLGPAAAAASVLMQADIDSDDEDAEAMQTPRQKWYLRTRRVLAAMLTLALLVAATLLKVFLPNKVRWPADVKCIEW